ncbi:MAG: uracil-DNA glycosylase [Treponema sp.]|nr:uracil-DNA glycosylase [Treponema sp.]
MNGKEINQIYNLLKACSSNVNGYVPEFYINEKLVDDDFSLNTLPVEKNVKAEESVITEETVKAEESVKTAQSIPQVQDLSKIDELKGKIEKCTRCPLARERLNVISGTGVETPEVLVICEFPTVNEIIENKPLNSREGILLEKMIGAIGLNKDTNTYITTAVKCRTQNIKIDYMQYDACSAFLYAQIQILKPKMILCLGENSYQKLIDNPQKIESIHGQLLSYNNIPLVATYSPSSLLQNESLKKPAWDDLKFIKKNLDSIK